MIFFQAVSNEIISIESLQKDQHAIKRLSTLQSQCCNQIKDYSELNNKIETLHNNLFMLSIDINRADLTLSGLENESHKNRHTSETSCKTYQVK